MEFLPDLTGLFPVIDRVGGLELPRFDYVELELTVRTFTVREARQQRQRMAPGLELILRWQHSHGAAHGGVVR